MACDNCRNVARCPRCAGPLAQESSSDALTCRWCAAVHNDLACAECGARRWRAVVIGNIRTAEELGRAFPGVPVVRSSGAEVVDRVAAEPALVVATPGAEPVADAGYGAALLLDGWACSVVPTCGPGRRRCGAGLTPAALRGRPRRAGWSCWPARRARAVQALIRWDPVGFAERRPPRAPNSASRRPAGWRPWTGPDRHRGAAGRAELPSDAEVLGPVPASDEIERTLVRVPRADGAGWPPR